MEMILVTGASGFLGSELLRQLLAQSRYHIIASTDSVDKLKSAFGTRNIDYVTREYLLSEEFVRMDIRCAVNCAFPRNKNGYEMAEGLKYIENVFHQFARGGVHSLINISSQSVYDQARTCTASEEFALCLSTPYAVGKYMTERMTDIICNEIPHTNLRMASLIGPGFNQRVVNRLTEKALKQEVLSAKYSHQRFGFLDCEDAAAAVLSLLDISPSIWKTVYNVGNGKGYTIEEIVHSISSVFKEQNRVFPDISWESDELISSTSVDGSLLFGDTGFAAEISLDESVKRILMWYEGNQT